MCPGRPTFNGRQASIKHPASRRGLGAMIAVTREGRYYNCAEIEMTEVSSNIIRRYLMRAKSGSAASSRITCRRNTVWRHLHVIDLKEADSIERIRMREC